MSNAPRAGQVEQPLPELGRAGSGVRAAPVRLILFPGQLGTAGRAVGRELELALVAGAQVGHRGHDFGDDVPGLAQHDHVADEHALALHFTAVVQGGHLHRGTADLGRLHHPERRHPAGAAHVDLDVQQPGGHFLRRVLVGHGPARCARGGAERALGVQPVQLDHHAVDLVRRIVPVLGVEADVLVHRGQVRHDLDPVAGRQAPCAQAVVPAGLGLGRALAAGETLHQADSVHDQIQCAAGRDPRILLPQRTRRRVARVGERGLARLGEALVQLLERLDRQEDLTSHLQRLRVATARELGRDRVDGADVRRDVFPGPAVTAGRAADQAAVAVDQRDGQAVDLQLAQVRPGAAAAGGPIGPGVELLG